LEKPASLAVALYWGIGSSSLNALVKVFDKLHTKDWHAGRVTKALFRSVVEDAMNDFPELTLRRALRHFMYWEGAGEVTTVATFLRRYPWSRQVFQAAKKKLG
jgi:predicted nucleic acid-binding protein